MCAGTCQKSVSEFQLRDAIISPAERLRKEKWHAVSPKQKDRGPT